jgi:hypothetical protein
MQERVLPQEVKANAQTRAGIQNMKEEIERAENAVRQAHKRLLIKHHPDKNFGKDMTPVLDLISGAVNNSEQEFRRAKKWLDQRSEALGVQP